MVLNNDEDLCECSVCFEPFDNNTNIVSFNCDTCVSKICSCCYDKISILDYKAENKSIIYKTKCPCCRSNTEKTIEDFNKEQLKALLLDSISHQAVFAETIMMIKYSVYDKKTKLCNNLKKLIEPATNLLVL
jgi:hypothetical protein